MAYRLELPTIIKISHELRNNGKKVIFTHGTFDLFHSGHALFLKESKRLGDILIVGVDSDEKVRKFKGNKRPIVPLDKRIEIILSNKFVDFVFGIDKMAKDENAFYIDMYKKIYPNIVTYGSNFVYKENFKTKIKGVRYKELNIVISTATEIIQDILDKYKE